jgi:hypothetical protein
MEVPARADIAKDKHRAIKIERLKIEIVQNL